MFSTIAISPYIQVQGPVSQMLPGGRVAITVSGRRYVGHPLDVPCAMVRVQPVATTADEG